jgi:hypothetical protein
MNSISRILCSKDEKFHPDETYQFDKNMRLSITFPFRITSNNEDVYVIDWETIDTGKILIFSERGRLKSIYVGNKNIIQEHMFKPTALAHMPKRNIIIVGTNNYILHFLSSQGDLLFYKDTTEFGLFSPGCLQYNKSDTLIISGLEIDPQCFADNKVNFLKIIWYMHINIPIVKSVEDPNNDKSMPVSDSLRISSTTTAVLIIICALIAVLVIYLNIF